MAAKNRPQLDYDAMYLSKQSNLNGYGQGLDSADLIN